MLSNFGEQFKLRYEEWMKIDKALFWIDIICKIGNTDCFAKVKKNLFKIKSFQFFISSLGPEKGNGIREKSKIVCELLENPDVLEDERKRAKEMRAKLSGMSSQNST